MIRLQEKETENEDSVPDMNFKHILGAVILCCVIILPLIIQQRELLNVYETKDLIALYAHQWM